MTQITRISAWDHPDLCPFRLYYRTTSSAMTDQVIQALPVDQPIWNRFLTIAPLVLIGTREGDGIDLAPKHMVTALGHDHYFAFVCTPRHNTYHNLQKTGTFSVSFPKPDQVVLSALAASPRCEEVNTKPILRHFPIRYYTGHADPFLDGSYLYFACEHDRTIDGFGHHSLICGHIKGVWVDQDYLLDMEKDPDQQLRDYPLLAYLAYGRFARIDTSFAFPLPKDFAT